MAASSATAMADSGSDSASDVGRVSGRGGLAVTAAKVYFILTGLVQQVVLKAVLGLDGYGALSSALSAASIAYNPLVSASLQGVSHAVATSSSGEREVALRTTLRVHFSIAVLAGAAFWLLAPFLGGAAGALHVVTGLRILSIVLLLYGLYAPLVGALNGMTRFGMQAALDALAATLRTLGLIFGALWLERAGEGAWGGVEGATLGFGASALVVFIVAIARVGTGRSGAGGVRVDAYLRFLAPILLSQVLLNLLFQADQLLLRRFAADAAMAAGMDARAADPLVGAYRATQLFCFLPYQLVLSVAIVLFPLVARAHRDGERENVGRYVEQAMRLALIVGGLVVSVTASLAEPLLRLVFGADTAALGAAAMRILSFGLGSLALLGVLTAVLNALGRPRLGLIVMGLACALVAALCFSQTRGVAFGTELLRQTAIATSSAMLAATGVAAWLVRQHAGRVLAPLTLLRVLLALAAAFAGTSLWPEPSGFRTLVASALAASVYVLVLFLTREVRPAELARVGRLLGRRR
jgi:stage V sporulation protein B